MKKLFLTIFILLSCSLSVFNAVNAAEPLAQEKAFHFAASIDNPNGILLNWRLEPGYFIYKQRLQFHIKDNKGAHLGSLQLPTAKIKQDPTTGPYPVYYNNLKIVLPILGTIAGTSEVLVNYQGCADSGFCYPPQTVRLDVNFDDQLAATAVEVHKVKRTIVPQTDLSKLQQLLASHNLWLIMLGFFGWGIILAFYPCNYPMIPIISGLILGNGNNITGGKAFRLSLAYVVGLAIAYAMIGVIAALIGNNMQAVLQKPAIIITASMVFVLLALAMFDVINIELPKSLQARLSNIMQHQKRGAYFSVAVMGFLTALIVSPCVTPPLSAALIYIAKTGDVFLGASALFLLGLGTGTPLLLSVTSAAKILPKAGQWMNTLKHLFGILFLAVAIYLLERVLIGEVIMVLWALLLSTSAVFMGAFRVASTTWSKTIKGLSLLMLLYSGILIVGATTGNTNPFRPLDTLLPESAKVKQAKFTTVKTIEDVNQAVAKAAKAGRPVILDFYADWCLACKDLERNVFGDKEVCKSLENYVLLRANVTANDAEDQALEKHFEVVAPPTLIFFDRSGKEIKAAKLVGDVSKTVFLGHIRALFP